MAGEQATFVETLAPDHMIYWVAGNDGLSRVDYQYVRRPVSLPFTVKATSYQWYEIAARVEVTTEGDDPSNATRVATVRLDPPGVTLTRDEIPRHRPKWDSFVEEVYRLVRSSRV